jgi:hypothetical protein
MTVPSVHSFPSCNRSKCAWGFKGKGLKLENRGLESSSRGAKNTDSNLRLQKEKGPERWARIGKLC